MDLNSVLAAVGKMFPNANLNVAVQKAQELITQTPNSLDGARITAQNLGITIQDINELYSKYGNTVRGRAICSMLGTTPEALRDDADMIVGGMVTPSKMSNASQNGQMKFPRLK